MIDGGSPRSLSVLIFPRMEVILDTNAPSPFLNGAPSIKEVLDQAAMVYFFLIVLGKR